MIQEIFYFKKIEKVITLVGIYRNCPNFWVPPIISGMGKATGFKFCMHIHRVNQNKKAHEKFDKSSHGRSQVVPKILRATIYGAHCAVIFVIAQLSCYSIPNNT